MVHENFPKAFSLIIGFFCLPSSSKSGNMKEAEALITEMESEGIELKGLTLDTLIDGYANLQDESKCLYLFEKLKVNVFGLKLSINHCLKQYQM